jgi:hypothetical protein
VTVCIAALAASGDCIVCIADKALAFGEDTVWDSDCNKIIPLGNNEAVALTSGSDRHITRFLRKIAAFSGYSRSRSALITVLEEQYRICVKEIQDIEVLTPHMLTRDEYLSAISLSHVNAIITSIDHQLKECADRFDCEVLICGFENKTKPYILDIIPPGLVIDCTTNGLHSVGTGADRAMQRLLFCDHKRTHNVSHTLCDCFDAKANAEMSASVGYEWDAGLLSAGIVRTVVPDIKPLLDKVWAHRNRSPFKKIKDPDDLPNPPRDWELRLRKMVADSLGVPFDETSEGRPF